MLMAVSIREREREKNRVGRLVPGKSERQGNKIETIITIYIVKPSNKGHWDYLLLKR